MSSTILQRRSIPLIPLLAREIGTNEALVLQQISYWMERSKTSHAGRKWVYNTTKEWVEKEFCFMSESTLKRVLNNLKKLGLIESKQLSKRTGYHINYYTVNHAAVAKLDAKITAIEMQEIKDLEVDDLDSISSEVIPIGSEWSNDNSIGSEWSNHEEVNMDSSRTGQNDPIISESSHRVHSESSYNIDTEVKKTKPTKFKPKKPDGVSEQVWNDLLQLRKTKRAAESQTAWKAIDNALEKVQQATGHSLEQIITEWIAADWKGFRFDWYMNRVKPTNQPNQQTTNQVNNNEQQSERERYQQMVRDQFGQSDPTIRTVN